VEPVWDQPKRGYDILSRELDGKERLIEVKAARRSGKRLSFFLSAYEWKMCFTDSLLNALFSLFSG
jgi:Domain of unknown function (DUF3883)